MLNVARAFFASQDAYIEVEADVINEHATLVREFTAADPSRYSRSMFVSSYFFDPFFYKGYDAVKVYTRCVSVRDYENVFFPLCLMHRRHWVLVHLTVISNGGEKRQFVFTLYDSCHYKTFVRYVKIS